MENCESRNFASLPLPAGARHGSEMKLSEYEQTVLRHMHEGTIDNLTKAGALWSAIEVLVDSGFFKAGKLTGKELDALK